MAEAETMALLRANRGVSEQPAPVDTSKPATFHEAIQERSAELRDRVGGKQAAAARAERNAEFARQYRESRA